MFPELWEESGKASCEAVPVSVWLPCGVKNVIPLVGSASANGLPTTNNHPRTVD